MGDRGNIKIKYKDGQEIFFYTHWYGSEIPENVKQALDRGRERWDQEGYLARIIFSQLILNTGDHEAVLKELTGFGIQPYEVDMGELISIDMKKQEVEWKDRTYTFDSFAGMPLIEWMKEINEN